MDQEANSQTAKPAGEARPPAEAAEPPVTRPISSSALDAIADKMLAGTNGGMGNHSLTGGNHSLTGITGGIAGGIEGIEPRRRSRLETYKHPMVVDLAIAIGLLFAMGALTISFVRTYTAHSAKTSIMQGNYKAAIQILRGAPVPDIFGGAGMENSDDLLNQALYLDAMEKLDNDHNDQTAPQELAKITPGSRFYDLAQEQLERLNQLKLEGPALERPSGGAEKPEKEPAQGQALPGNSEKSETEKPAQASQTPPDSGEPAQASGQ